MAKVFVSRRVVGLERYADQLDLDIWEAPVPPPRDVLIARTQGCAGLVSMLTDKLDVPFFEAVPELRVVSQYAVGVNNIDLEAARIRGIPVGHTPGVLTDSTADMAWSLMLAAARNIVPGSAYARSGHWKTWETMLLLGQSVHGATLGIIGYGRIGQAVAERSRGFKMRVLASHTHPIADPLVESVSLETLLRQSDFVSIHTPLTPSTRHLMGKRELALMKPTATLVNTARGEIVDPVALAAALRAGQPAFAALDVTEPEPLPPDSPLYALPNCLIVPHLGSATLQARLAMTQSAMANLVAALRGDPMPHCANGV